MLCLFGEKSWVGPEPFLSYYSRVENTFAFASRGRIFSNVGIWYFGLFKAWFRSLGSKHILILPGLATMTMLLIHSVGSVTFFMMPLFSRSNNFSFTSSRSATSTRLGECWSGFTLSSVTNVELPMWPNPSKTSLYLVKMASLVRGGFTAYSTL